MIDRSTIDESVRLVADLAEELAQEISADLMAENYKVARPSLALLARARTLLDAAEYPAGPALLETLEIADAQGSLPDAHQHGRQQHAT